MRVGGKETNWDTERQGESSLQAPQKSFLNDPSNAAW